MTIRPLFFVAIGMAGALALLASGGARSAGPAPASFPAPPAQKSKAEGDQVAVLAGGCFWGIEGLFEHVRGVKSATSGYAGGTRVTANYSDVSSEQTGHAEAVRIVFDPQTVSYGQLLRIFFSVAHDPTQVNRQHPDVGPSYRSAIFPQNPTQQATAAAYIAALDKAGVFAKPVATRLETGRFYPAESHHQNYMRRNPKASYIQRYDLPKLAAFRKAYPRLYRP